jgi:hypothetical protein
MTGESFSTLKLKLQKLPLFKTVTILIKILQSRPIFDLKIRLIWKGTGCLGVPLRDTFLSGLHDHKIVCGMCPAVAQDRLLDALHIYKVTF